MSSQIVSPFGREFLIHDNAVHGGHRRDAGKGDIVQLGVIHHQIFFTRVLQGGLVKAGAPVVCIRDAIADMYAPAGNEGLVHEIAFQSFNSALADEILVFRGKFTADHMKLDRIKGRQDIGDFQGRGQHGQLSVRNFSGD